MLAGLLKLLRFALLGAALFTGAGVVLHADDAGGAVLYTLLCALCVLGLTVKPASKRTSA